MNKLQIGLQFSGAFILAVLAALISFGLLLAGLDWLLGETQAAQLASLLISTAAAMLLGGLTAGWLFRIAPLRAAAAFGLIFGGFAFSYVLIGSAWHLPFFASGLALAAFGGRLAKRVTIS